MFGTLRTLLAIMVLVGHLFWHSDYGRFAVSAFFVLSGYLMTYVMQNTYKYDGYGMTNFALNRMLRLLPTYWVILIISVFAIQLVGEINARQLNPFMELPQTSIEWLANISLIYPDVIPQRFEPRLSPATWALTTEIAFYAAIALGISKSKTHVLVWLALSVGYYLATYVLNLYWHSRYFAIPAGSLPFSLGALIYFINQEQPVKNLLNLRLLQPSIIFIIFLLNATLATTYLGNDTSQPLFELFVYLNILLTFLLILSLSTGKKLFSFISPKVDKAIGDFSYPIYINHWLCALVASAALGIEVENLKQNPTIEYIGVVTVLCFALSMITIICIDKQADRLKTTLKSKLLKLQ